MKKYSAWFAGTITITLLGLYVFTMVYMLYSLIVHDAKDFPTGITYVITTVGGLISALVIAQLTATEPGEDPTKTLTFKLVPVVYNKVDNKENTSNSGSRKSNTDNVTNNDKKLMKTASWITLSYLLSWFLLGFLCLIIGTLFYPDVNQTISDIGTTWFGLAISASYSYFGIRPGAAT